MRMRLLQPAIATITIVAITIQGTPAAADDTMDWPEWAGTDPAVTSLAEEYGLSLAEATERIGWQDQVSVAAPVIEQRLGDSFAGLRADEAGGGRIKLAVTGDTPTARAVLVETGVSSFTDPRKLERARSVPRC